MDYSRLLSELKYILLSLLAGLLAVFALLGAAGGRPLAAALGNPFAVSEWDRLSRFLLVNSTLLTSLSLAFYIVFFFNDDLLCGYRDVLVFLASLLLVVLGFAHLAVLPAYWLG
jgi:hypothetical protein